MSGMKVVITARDFDVGDAAASRLLSKTGFEVYNYTDFSFGAGMNGDVLSKLIGDAECVIVGSEEMTAEVMARTPRLRLISRRGVGTDSIDLSEAQKRGITVTKTLRTVESAVAEHIMAYLLYFSRRIDRQNASIHAGEWNRLMMPGLKGRTLGLVGFGAIAQETAKRARPFGVRLLTYCRHPKSEWEEAFGVKSVPLNQLLAQSDYVSINVPLSPETAGMFNRDTIREMKPSSILINTARSAIVVESALKEALDQKWLAGAAIDVFEEEPYLNNPFLGYENVVMTPHTGPFTMENFVDVNLMAAQNVLDYCQGKLPPENIVV